jgi:hypothetical protein
MDCGIPQSGRIRGFRWSYCNLGILESYIPLSRWRERVGVREDMISDDSPSPTSSPPWGEEFIVRSVKLSLIRWRCFVQRFHDLYILLLTMITPDPMLTWLKVGVFHHLITVRTAGGK